MEQLLGTGGTITLIHFVNQLEVPTGDEDKPGLEWRIACMPNMTEFHQTPYHPNYQRTDEVRAVTCPACKMSVIFKKSKELLEARSSIRAK